MTRRELVGREREAGGMLSRTNGARRARRTERTEPAVRTERTERTERAATAGTRPPVRPRWARRTALVGAVVGALLTASMSMTAAQADPATQPNPADPASTAATAATAATAERNAPAAPAVVDGPPILDGPVFNDPAADSGTGQPSERQTAVMDQLIRLIQAVPEGGEIAFVMHTFSPGDRSTSVADALVAAHRSGVDVRVILDGQDSENAEIRALLQAELGDDEDAASWVVGCEDFSTTDRGCIARNYMHSKFGLFSTVRVDGVDHPNVVFQTSSNLSDWYVYNSYNDGYTFSDADTYQAYATYFEDLRVGRTQPVNPNYFWTTPSGSEHRAMFFPRGATSGDPVVNILKLVECSYTDEQGATQRTEIRLTVSGFTKHRVAIAEELLRLRGEGCGVDLVYYDNTGNVEPEVREVLERATPGGEYIQLTPCRYQRGTDPDRYVQPHTKVLMLDGYYHDDTTPRVYTGSANFTHLENADDSWLRVTGRAVHDSYQEWFEGVRDACAAGAGS